MFHKIPLFLTVTYLLLTHSDCLAEHARPNVIVLLADDMGYGDIAAHGNPVLKTPNFDRMCGQSARFTNFAVSPSCGPTRAALMTGKHEFLSGNTHTLKAFRNTSLKSTMLAELFKARGYRTGMFGKWHLGLEGPYHPGKRGFDETLHTVGDNYKTTHFNPTLVKNGVETRYKGYRTDIFFNEAMNFITRHKDEPFFVYLPTHSPHSPHKVPGKYEGPYRGYVEDPQNANKKISKGFLGQIANLDENLGRLLALVDKLGLHDKTLFIAMTDNGGTSGVDIFNDGRRGVKGTIWSGGTRAFSFWRWGNRYKPGPRPQMTGHVDFLPTLADLCGLKIPQGLQTQLEGDSLRPLLEVADAQLDATRMQVHHVGRWANPKDWAAHKYSAASVRWQNWTLVRTDACSNDRCMRCRSKYDASNPGRRGGYTKNQEHHALVTPGRWALFDIESDPYQSTDIAAKHPGIVRRMAAHYERWWERAAAFLADHYGELR